MKKFKAVLIDHSIYDGRYFRAGNSKVVYVFRYKKESGLYDVLGPDNVTIPDYKFEIVNIAIRSGDWVLVKE